MLAKHAPQHQMDSNPSTHTTSSQKQRCIYYVSKVDTTRVQPRDQPLDHPNDEMMQLIQQEQEAVF